MNEMNEIIDLDPWLAAMFRCVDNFFFEHPGSHVYQFKIPARFRAVWDLDHIIDRIRNIELEDVPNQIIPDYGTIIRPRWEGDDHELWVTATVIAGSMSWDEDTEWNEVARPAGYNATVVH